MHGNPKGRRVKRIVTSVICFVFFFYLNGSGQEGIDYNLKKPDKYENRTLGYEKTTETKWTVPRAFLQNTITQYNFYFNANNKLNEVLARAKAQFKEDYTQLLPFYNYTLETTSKDKRNLDSVIDKINSAILCMIYETAGMTICTCLWAGPIFIKITWILPIFFFNS